LELFEVRRILEPATAHLAAGRMTPEGIGRLRDSLKTVDEYSSVEELVAHDLTFHGVIAQAAGNEYLGSLVEALYSSTIRARIWQDVMQDNAVASALDDHRTIVDALEQGDAELVKALVTVHVSKLEKRLRRTL
jgi:GntR family transcriptional repressor for pyruvate dehydrogenase complex